MQSNENVPESGKSLLTDFNPADRAVEAPECYQLGRSQAILHDQLYTIMAVTVRNLLTSARRVYTIPCNSALAFPR